MVTLVAAHVAAKHTQGTIAWDPLIIAAAIFALAALPYFRHSKEGKEGKMPRVFGVLTAAGVMFAAAGVPSLMSLAHHKASDDLILLAYVLGAILAGVLFYIIVVQGNHKERVFKRIGGTSGDRGSRKTSPRAPHHRAAAATIGAAVFAALIAFHFGALIHAGGHGGSQAYHEIFQ